MRLRDLRDLYAYELHEMRDAEDQLIRMLPRMAGAATDQELADQFERHMRTSRTHKERIDEILSDVESPGDDVRSEGVRGLMRTAERFLDSGSEMDAAVRDAALLALAQRVEHLEMASYGSLRTYADLLGEDEARDLLQQTLDEEGQADDRLTRIALRSVNREARN